MELVQILWDRREFFLTCLLEHIRISLTAVVCAGVLGILAGGALSSVGLHLIYAFFFFRK